MNKNDSVMTCNTVIPFVANMLKKIYLSNNLFTEFKSKLLKKNVSFSYFFRNYIDKTVDDIHHTELTYEFKPNTDKASYESHLERCVALTYEISVLEHSADKKYW